METKYFSTDPESWDKVQSTESGLTEFTYKEDVFEKNIPEGIDMETIDKVLGYLKDVKEDGVTAATLVNENYFKENEDANETIVNFKYGKMDNDKISVYTNRNHEYQDDKNQTVQTTVIKIKDYNESLLVSEEVRKACSDYLMKNL